MTVGVGINGPAARGHPNRLLDLAAPAADGR